jgi:hypothetical protein
MTPSKPDRDEPEKPAGPAPTVSSTPEPTPAPAPAPVAENTASVYEPYPGAAFFHGGRHSPIVSAMAHRLHEEGCSNGRRLGADWTNAHRDAFATWQKQLRPKEGGDVSGTPDQIAWDKLRVPRVSPLPKETP